MDERCGAMRLRRMQKFLKSPCCWEGRDATRQLLLVVPKKEKLANVLAFVKVHEHVVNT